MQNLTNEISKIFTRHQNKTVAQVAQKDLKEIASKLTEYLMSLGSQFNEISKLKNELTANRFCDNKTNILHIAAKFCDTNQLQGIIEVVGPEFINVCDTDNHTPLHHSAIGGVTQNAIFLMNEGADMHSKSSDATRNWLPIHYATKSGAMDLVLEMLNRGANPNDKTSFGLNCLHIACEFGHPDLVKHLISLGMDIEATTNFENFNMTPLHFAAIGNFQKIVEILLDHGASRNRTNNQGYSALDLATLKGETEFIKFLLERGIISYDTAYEIAKMDGKYIAADLIKKYIQMRDKLFNKKQLRIAALYLENILANITADSLEETKITMEEELKINFFGIISICKKVGFFTKKEMNLEAFARKANLHNLAYSLAHIRQIADLKKSPIKIE